MVDPKLAQMHEPGDNAVHAAPALPAKSCVMACFTISALSIFVCGHDYHMPPCYIEKASEASVRVMRLQPQRSPQSALQSS